MMSSFAVLMAFFPLLGYLFFLAVIRISGLGLVITGSRDTMAVATAIVGLVVIGPMEIFFPESSAIIWGSWIWLPLLALYFLAAAFLAMSATPKLIVYGRTPNEIFPLLIQVCRSMDSDAKVQDDLWLVELPSLPARVRLEGTAGYDVVSVIAFEPHLSNVFWSRLRSRLRKEIHAERELRAERGKRRGWIALVFSSIGLLWLLRLALTQPQTLAAEFRDWLFR